MTLFTLKEIQKVRKPGCSVCPLLAFLYFSFPFKTSLSLTKMIKNSGTIKAYNKQIHWWEVHHFWRMIQWTALCAEINRLINILSWKRILDKYACISGNLQNTAKQKSTLHALSCRTTFHFSCYIIIVRKETDRRHIEDISLLC